MGLYETYIASLGEKPSASSRSIARRFCEWLGSRTPTKGVVEAWMKHREGAGYSKGSLAREWGIIRRICITNTLEWPFTRHEGPQVSEGDERRPILSQDAIDAMIRSSFHGDAELRARLAVATTYGVRRVELQELHPESFDWTGQTIYIATAKFGRQRYHCIPEEILPVLKASKWRTRSDAYISQEFVQLRTAVGIDAQEIGWHSIRRAAVRMSAQSHNGIEGLSETERTIFFRWKAASMANRYVSGMIIGLAGEGDQHAVGLADEALDIRAFSLNPWLKIWDLYT